MNNTPELKSIVSVRTAGDFRQSAGEFNATWLIAGRDVIDDK